MIEYIVAELQQLFYQRILKETKTWEYTVKVHESIMWI